MSHLLELLGRGLEGDVGEVLARYYWSPPARSLDKLKALAGEHPDWPDVQFQLGLNYLRDLRTAEAVACLALACRQKPDFLAARLALAAAHEDAGDINAALEQLAIANQNSPGQAEVLFAIGFCHERLRNPEQAAVYYQDAIARNGSLTAARQRLAAVSVLLGNLSQAITQYQALLAASPQEVYLHTALAHLYFRDGRHGEAVKEFETAIAMEPANWSLIDDEVEALVADGLIREAIERLTYLIEQQGEFPDLHLRLGDLYSQSGDDDQAMRHYLQARNLQPNYLEAAVKVGTHHMTFGRWDEAAESFCEASGLNDDLLVNYVGMGVAQLHGGRRGEAMKSFELAAAIEPNSSMLLAEMARMQLKAALADDFLRTFDGGGKAAPGEIAMDNEHLLSRQLERHEQAVGAQGEHADVRYRYGVLLRAEGRLSEALEQLAQAVRINPAYVQAIIKLGITQQELGQIEEAVGTFKQALELAPQYVDLHYRLGLLYTDRRQFDLAVQEMEAAAAGAPDNQQVRASLALSLQNMGLMDRAAATWRSLWRLHNQAGAESSASRDDAAGRRGS